MSTLHYNIHNRIDVFVDGRLPRPITSTIDFQIGYFKTADARAMSPHRIDVRPYSEFGPGSDVVFDSFHLLRGVTGSCVDNPERRWAIRREEHGFSVFTDESLVITPFVQLLLMEHGISLVHAAAVADEAGRVTLLAGAGGVGKTAILGHLVREHGYRLLGDDNVGLKEDGTCLSMPRSFVLKEYHRTVYPEVFDRLGVGAESRGRKLAKSAVYGLIGVLGANAPFIGLSKVLLKHLGLLDRVSHRLAAPPKFDFLATVPVEEIFGSGCVAAEGKLDRIVFLQRYEGADLVAESISEEDLAGRMNAIILHEWSDSMRMLFTLGAFAMVDLDAYFGRVSAFIRGAICGKEAQILRIPAKVPPRDLANFFYSHFGSLQTV